MSFAKVLGIILIVAGVLALVYKGFSYTQESHAARVGKLELSLKQKKQVEVPTWAGVGSIVVGAGLLLAGSKR